MIILGILLPCIVIGSVSGEDLPIADGDNIPAYSEPASHIGFALWLHAKWFWGYFPFPRISRSVMNVGLLILVIGLVGRAYIFFT